MLYFTIIDYTLSLAREETDGRKRGQPPDTPGGAAEQRARQQSYDVI